MLKELLNKIFFSTETKKVEAPVAAPAPMPAPQPLPEPVPAPVLEPVTMATTSEPAPSVTTIEVKPEPAGVAAGDTLTINLTSDTIKFSAPEAPPAPKRGRKSKSKPQAAKPATKPATKPAVIKGGRKKK